MHGCVVKYTHRNYCRKEGENIMTRCANTAMDMMMSMCMCSMCMFCRAYISELQPSGVDIKDL